jgi:hypothetical protein
MKPGQRRVFSCPDAPTGCGKLFAARLTQSRQFSNGFLGDELEIDDN